MSSRGAMTAIAVGGLVAACGSDVQDAPETDLSRGTTAYVFRTGGDGLNVRERPTRQSAIVGGLAEGAPVVIGCQTTGDSVNGTSIWDYLPALGGYVSDAYIYTGYDGFAPGLSRCDSSGADEDDSDDGPLAGGSDASVQAAIDEARTHLGYTESGGNCNKFSSMLGRGCQEWCSDFVNYVWQKAGFAVDGITGYSGTIADYGARHGTLKSGMYASGVRPGDAVLWGYGSSPVGVQSKHVGMVTEVHANGDITVIHGNYAACAGGDCVYEKRISRANQVGTGTNIYAFVSPVR